MLYKYLIYTLLMLPNVAFAICANNSLSDFVRFENSIFIAFKVTDTHLSNTVDSYIDIEVIQEFNSNVIEDKNIRIKNESFLGPSVSEFSQNNEWLSVLVKTEKESYIFSACTPKLIVENETIIGDTGINALDNSDDILTIEKFALALNAYQQGISLADEVCKSANSYCKQTLATYDVETGILNLPTVTYPILGTPVYVKAKMQKTGDNPVTFTVIELNN